MFQVALALTHWLCTCRFCVGGFAPGVAVQPVLLDYSANKHFIPGWGLDESTPWHMWRVLTQLRTYIRLKILPVSQFQMQLGLANPADIQR